MNLISMININNERKERNISKVNNKALNKTDYGYSIYESIEYAKENLNQNSLRLQMEMIKNLVR